MIRSLIVDDEPLVRERLRTLLADHADVQIVGEAGDGPSALEAFAERAPAPGLPRHPDAGPERVGGGGGMAPRRAPCRSSSSSRPTISSRSRPFGCTRSTT